MLRPPEYPHGHPNIRIATRISASPTPTPHPANRATHQTKIDRNLQAIMTPVRFESHDDSHMNAVGKLDNSGDGDVIFGDKNIQQTRSPALATTIDESVPPLTAWQPRPEEAQIVEYFTRPEIRLVGIYGAGGFGKSALAAKVYGDATGFECKLWANFGQPKPFGTFALWLIAKAIGMERYAKERELYERNSDEDLLTRALNQWARKRVLLVMDNIETLLAETMAESSRNLYRQFWEAWLNRNSSGMLLLTTQEKVQLPLAEQREWLTLKGLEIAKGMALLQGEPFRIAGDEADLRAFVEAADGHPLLLRLAASWLVARAKDDGETAEIYRLQRDDVTLLRQITAAHRGDAEATVGKVLDASFDRLKEEWKLLLVRSSVLRGRVTEAAARVMVAETTLPDLRELARRSFWQEKRQGEDWVFEFLPLIRRYLGLKAGELGQVENAHQKAIEYLKTAIVPWDGTLASCEAQLELCHHHCELGRFGEAYYVMCTRFQVLNRRGYYRELVPVYERLTREWEAQTPEEEKHLGWAWTQLDNLYRNLGQYSSAIAANKKAQSIFFTLDDKDGIASSLVNLGNVYYLLGQYKRAIDFYGLSLEIARQIGDRHEEANSLMNLGNTYESLGQYKRAIDFYGSSLEIVRQIGDRNGQGGTLCNLGNAYQSLGQYQKAIELYESALIVQREVGNRQFEANSSIGLGNAYQSLGQYERAIDFYGSSLEIARQIGNRNGEGSSLGGLGNAYQSLGQYERAIDFHQQSLEIARQIGDRNREGSSLGSLGNAYQSLGRYERAIDFHQQSLEIARQIEDRNGEARSLFNQANALAKLNNYWDARQSYQQAKQICQELKLTHKVKDCNTAIYQLNQIIAATPRRAPSLVDEPPSQPDWYAKSLPTSGKTTPTRKSSKPPLWLFFCMGLAIALLIWWLR